jgi:hypothetical protein
MVTFNKDIKIIQWGKESNFSKSLFFPCGKKSNLKYVSHNTQKLRAGDMAQFVEHLPGKYKVLSSNLITREKIQKVI